MQTRTNLPQIFWGLLIVILDLSINGFDLLPDGLGYLIVAVGCGGLVTLSPRFATARTLCWVLAGLWLIGFVIHGEFLAVYGLGMAVGDCAMIWYLLGGIRDLAMKRDRPDLAKRAESRRIAFCLLVIGASLLGLLLHDSHDAGLVVVALAISIIVLLIMILHLIHRVKVELAI